MDTMRDLLRTQLRRSLRSLTELDRLAAAWPVVSGAVMAANGTISDYNCGTVHIRVDDPRWMRQMMAMQGQIMGELGRVAAVPVTAIHFERSTTHRDKQ